MGRVRNDLGLCTLSVLIEVLLLLHVYILPADLFLFSL